VAVAAALAAGLAAAVGLPAASGAVASSPCLGAASAASPPCYDPALRFRVTPTPSEAEITPSAPCTLEDADDGIFHTLGNAPGGGIYSLPPGGTASLRLCVFGAAPPVARQGFALLGDSHAGTWRAALDVVARARRWAGSSVTMASCTFNSARPILPAGLVVPCQQWRQEVVAWFFDNPEVDTVFVSAHTTARVVPSGGRSAFDTAVAGYVSAWQALPPTVRHIVVLRDTPYVPNTTGACVSRAISRHQQAGLACAVPRRSAVHSDPEVVAADGLGPRVQVIDLSRFFCGAGLCYPVIGGVLVYQDTNHMTRAYSATLGPYLGREIDRLLASSP
jgi:hypothetical protein